MTLAKFVVAGVKGARKQVTESYKRLGGDLASLLGTIKTLQESPTLMYQVVALNPKFQERQNEVFTLLGWWRSHVNAECRIRGAVAFNSRFNSDRYTFLA